VGRSTRTRSARRTHVWHPSPQPRQRRTAQWRRTRAFPQRFRPTGPHQPPLCNGHEPAPRLIATTRMRPRRL
jgi:hypothetical protein